jgi:hypothetical protein
MATVIVPVHQLRKAVKWAKPDPKNPLPVLANVKVTVTGGQLVLAVYDWETLLLARISGDGDGGTGTALIPADVLAAAVKSLKAPMVEVEVHHGVSMDLTAGPGTSDAHRTGVDQTIDAVAYPSLPAMPPILGWTTAAAFGPAAVQVAGCCADIGELPMISAVHFVPGPDLGIEGTDRFVLGLHHVPFHQAGADARDMLVPARLVTRFCEGLEGGPVFLGAGDGQVMLSDTWHTVVTRRPEGDYPHLRSRLESKHGKTVTAATVEVFASVLADIAAQATAVLAAACAAHLEQLLGDDTDERLAKDKRAEVKTRQGRGMFLAADGGTPAKAEIIAVHPWTGAVLARWSLTHATCDGDRVTVMLNPVYLARVLPDAGTVTIHLPGGYKPVRITAGSPYEGFICPIKGDPPARVTGIRYRDKPPDAYDHDVVPGFDPVTWGDLRPAPEGSKLTRRP